ncbi:hypothetical protein V6N13_143254 [Hibiscus sabdariffa]|uniref:Uncharacterized protein n=1 Tax=Hibiscus sabdariffa TaxID=183260 RepID=A0ABR2FGR0_9ROSI
MNCIITEHIMLISVHVYGTYFSVDNVFESQQLSWKRHIYLGLAGWLQKACAFLSGWKSNGNAGHKESKHFCKVKILMMLRMGGEFDAAESYSREPGSCSSIPTPPASKSNQTWR